MDLRSWKGKAHTCTCSHVSHAQACVPGMYVHGYTTAKQGKHVSVLQGLRSCGIHGVMCTCSQAQRRPGSQRWYQDFHVEPPRYGDSPRRLCTQEHVKWTLKAYASS